MYLYNIAVPQLVQSISYLAYFSQFLHTVYFHMSHGHCKANIIIIIIIIISEHDEVCQL